MQKVVLLFASTYEVAIRRLGTLDTPRNAGTGRELADWTKPRQFVFQMCDQHQWQRRNRSWTAYLDPLCLTISLSFSWTLLSAAVFVFCLGLRIQGHSL